MQGQYSGSAYIGVVGPDNEPGECRDSIEKLARREGDARPVFHRATKGYEARQMHLNNWYHGTNHAFMLLLDHDMWVPPDTLERLRSHGLPFVSGFYMRRRLNPLVPVWFYPYRGAWPLEPFMQIPERGKLHELGGSGWGCILLHRDVVTATRPLLKFEPEIIEDDMDIWPYDLFRVMEALRALRALVNERPSVPITWPALDHWVGTLEEEIKPLRGPITPQDADQIVGSDIRFPFFAARAGFKLYGDPDVRCGHILDYRLTPDDWNHQGDDYTAGAAKETHKYILEKRRENKSRLAELKGGLA